MAEIHLTAHGALLPMKHAARLRDKEWPGGGTVKELVLYIGDSKVIVWPADRDAIEELGKRLLEIATELSSSH